MNVLLDRTVAMCSFGLGTAVVLGAWLDLFPVHWGALFVGFQAMVLGGLSLGGQYFSGSDR